MNVDAALLELLARKARLERTIEELEALSGDGAGPRLKRRGGKSMGREERKAASQRFKRYGRGAAQQGK